MAITLTAGVDFYTDPSASAEDVKKSIDKAIADAKTLSANTVFIEIFNYIVYILKILC